MRLPFFVCLLVALCQLVAGCGGGGPADPSGGSGAAPIANAGANQTVTVGAIATLDGSASTAFDGHALSYSWTLAARPAGSQATLADAATAHPRLATDVEGSYLVALTVDDNVRRSTAQSVGVLARPLTLTGAAVQTAGALTVALSGAQATSLGNGQTRFTAQLQETNGSAGAVPGAYLVLWFSNGARLPAGFIDLGPVEPGPAGVAQRSYQFEAPSDWIPVTWEYGTRPDARGPNASLPQWRFPPAGP